MGRSARVVDQDAGSWSRVDPELARAFVAQLERERHHTAQLRLLAETGPALAFVRALEARCGDTAGHSDRIAQTSEMIAARLEVPDEHVKGIAMAARLHDIGKVGVPDSILWKPGPLDRRETEAMRTHSALGAEMLGSVRQPEAVCKIVRAHHERWDGCGYPDGLRGHEIPLGARIVTVADVYDALRSARPYRASLPREEALAYLAGGRGRNFDPVIIDLFEEIAAPEPPVGEVQEPGPAAVRPGTVGRSS